MKCLFSLKPGIFLEKFEDLVCYWQVRKETQKERFAALENSKQKKTLTEMADENKIEYNQTEIVSWLDNMAIMYSIFNEFRDQIEDEEINDDFFNDMHIIAEYHIPFNKNRIDYMIVKNEKILLIEFSYCDKEKSKEHYKRKLDQIIYYKDLLKSSLSEHIKIGIFTFLIKPEEEKYNSILVHSKHTKTKVSPNYDETLYLLELIKHTFSNTKKTAIEELDKLSDQYLYY